MFTGTTDRMEKKVRNQKRTARGCFWLFILFVSFVALYMMKGLLPIKYKEQLSPFERDTWNKT